MILFNENKEIPIIKVSDSFFERKTYQIGTCFSDDVIKLLKYQDKKQIKESSLVIINGIKLSTNDKNSLITKRWVYTISYSIYLSGILVGSKFTIGKSKFEQDLRDIKLNNLLD
jgi:hypothetical protein